MDEVTFDLLHNEETSTWTFTINTNNVTFVVDLTHEQFQVMTKLIWGNE